MRFRAILNRGGGTLRTLDLDAFVQSMEEALAAHGHDVDSFVIDGDDLPEQLETAVADEAVDVVLIGGGDGSVSAAAGALMNTDKILAVLPAGTMNLFARSLGIPLQLNEAVAAFGTAPTRQVDIATANGRPFVHQYSIGMHAKMVHLREKREFSSRLGKIRASTQAAITTLLNPPKMRLELDLFDGEKMQVTTSSLGVSNNLFGEGHIPYADHPDGGILGIYVTSASERHEMFKMAFNMLRGRWRDNDQVEIRETSSVDIRLLSRQRGLRCVIDGELTKLERETRIEIHPGALNVLMPDIG